MSSNTFYTWLMSYLNTELGAPRSPPLKSSRITRRDTDAPIIPAFGSHMYSRLTTFHSDYEREQKASTPRCSTTAGLVSSDGGMDFTPDCTAASTKGSSGGCISAGGEDDWESLSVFVYSAQEEKETAERERRTKRAAQEWSDDSGFCTFEENRWVPVMAGSVVCEEWAKAMDI